MAKQNFAAQLKKLRNAGEKGVLSDSDIKRIKRKKEKAKQRLRNAGEKGPLSDADIKRARRRK